MLNPWLPLRTLFIFYLAENKAGLISAQDPAVRKESHKIISHEGILKKGGNNEHSENCVIRGFPDAAMEPPVATAPDQ